MPLRIGANRLQVRSTDVAGNTGPWAEVQVERRGGFVLRGALQSPVDLSIGALLPIRIQVNNDAAHPQPSVQLRVLARDSRGIERALDVRTHSFTPGESLQYQVSSSTAEWPAGALNLRLLAADEVEVQLADARVELRGQPALPPPCPGRARFRSISLGCSRGCCSSCSQRLAQRCVAGGANREPPLRLVSAAASGPFVHLSLAAAAYVSSIRACAGLPDPLAVAPG